VDRDDERLRKGFDAVGEALDTLPRVSASGSSSAGNSAMSAPALKPRGPAPRSSATYVVASVARVSSADSSARTTARLMAFTGGRSIVIVVTPPDRSRCTSSGGS